MMDILRCPLAVMVTVSCQRHQIEINSHTHARLCVCKSHHTKFDIFFVLFWNVSRAVRVVGVQLFVVVLCTLFVLLRKRQASLVANANERDTTRSLGFVCRSLRLSFFLSGLNRFAILTVGDRQSRHWRRGTCVLLSRSVVRVRGDGVFFLFFFCFFWLSLGAARSCGGALLMAYALCSALRARIGAVCVARILCAARALCATRALLSLFLHHTARHGCFSFPCK